MASSKKNLPKLLLTLMLLLVAINSYAQNITCDEIENDLVETSSKVFPFYHRDEDSLEYYSNQFTSKITNYVVNYPTTLNYPFQKLQQDRSFRVATSPDSCFRIYSWDTWLGGTMHVYKNIYQYVYGGKTYATVLNFGEGDAGGDLASTIYVLKTVHKTYYLAVSYFSESSSIKSQAINVYSIAHDSLDYSVPLIKAKDDTVNYINIEYNSPPSGYSGGDLIKYDTDKRIIYIPVVLESGKVTDSYIQYQFNGQYFERLNADSNSK